MKQDEQDKIVSIGKNIGTKYFYEIFILLE